jgi:hypothetical protein
MIDDSNGSTHSLCNLFRSSDMPDWELLAVFLEKKLFLLKCL